jgi:hypothetical protein
MITLSTISTEIRQATALQPDYGTESSLGGSRFFEASR